MYVYLYALSSNSNISHYWLQYFGDITTNNVMQHSYVDTSITFRRFDVLEISY